MDYNLNRGTITNYVGGKLNIGTYQGGNLNVSRTIVNEFGGTFDNSGTVTTVNIDPSLVGIDNFGALNNAHIINNGGTLINECGSTYSGNPPLGNPANNVSCNSNISINDVSVVEGNSGTLNLVFSVTRTGNLASGASVEFTTADVTATVANADYAAKSGTVNFSGGQPGTTIAIVVKGDNSVEPTETFNVNLSNCVNCGISDSQGIGTIQNDDFPSGLLPNTKINSKIDGNGLAMLYGGNTTSTSMTFKFYGIDDTTPSYKMTFECRLDSHAESSFTLCTRPITYSNLAHGGHTFEVRSIDKEGNKDLSPAIFKWTNDVTPPDTRIKPKLDGNGIPIADNGSTTSTTIQFSFYGIDDSVASSNLKFECRLDSTLESAFSACGRPITYTGLSVGEHTFEVRAVDKAGNKDPTPAKFTWNVTSS